MMFCSHTLRQKSDCKATVSKVVWPEHRRESCRGFALGKSLQLLRMFKDALRNVFIPVSLVGMDNIHVTFAKINDFQI